MKIDFVFGCGHSGTTLIANILGNHSCIYCPSEETNMMFPENESERIYNKLCKEATKLQKTRIVEKTPKHILYIKELRQKFPDTKFIVPVRDGRDVAASIKKRTGDLGAGIYRWKSEVSILLEYIEDENFFIYRHEDFVSDPEFVLKKICNFLDIDFEQNMLNYHSRPKSWFGVSHEVYSEGVGPGEHEKRRSWQVNQPIFDNSGRWKTELSQDEIDFMYKKLFDDTEGKKLMKFFSYV
ncbi:hypothetical protein CUU95_12575 [Vreelandella alkaliphila]|uniref:sulfotransferase family protein n=1 Tax=Vreelandella alkaliphila TaxID=272774 RepID=UPI000EA1AD68|nr:sulfotransferase [Halomonas alkaliphila]AYF34588.1 hypothetical protein CUU95_12575 [Halomonas alkaliphila]